MTEPRCDLVLLSWNHLELTRPCIESLLAHTTLPARLIVVDQSSREETRSYLESLQPTSCLQVEVLFNLSNVGYPKGMNLGLTRAKAPFVCFLNNDILVPPGWLEEMISVMEADPSIGTACPASNTFNLHPPASIDWLAYAQTCSARRGCWIEIPYGEGFCLLARTEVMRKVGGFDETTYEQIYFEDADLGRKIQAEGLRCVMTEGTYVWHHGGKTMASHPDRLHLFQENKQRFLKKWGGAQGKNALYAMSGCCDECLDRAVEKARDEANRSGKIWILADLRLRKEGLPHHLNIRILKTRRWMLPGLVLWKSIGKKKKFEVIYTDWPLLGWVLALFRPLHRASIQLL